MWVVKIGGSLAGSTRLTDWLECLSVRGRGNVVIVPGGGVFADQVRRLQKQRNFDDSTAHRMALLAMQQYGIMLASFAAGLETAANMEQIHGVLERGLVPVWLPDYEELHRCGVAENWDVTSDSLAAWLAAGAGATRLVLLKHLTVSADRAGIAQLVADNVLDPAFPEFVANGNFSVRVHSVDDPGGFPWQPD